jgi:hypothetical protein
MTSVADEERAIEINRGLVTAGLIMVGIGSLLAMAGGLAATVAALGATRSWVQQWDEPPNAKARRAYQQARSAAAAGAQGWRQNSQPSADLGAR